MWLLSPSESPWKKASFSRILTIEWPWPANRASFRDCSDQIALRMHMLRMRIYCCLVAFLFLCTPAKSASFDDDADGATPAFTQVPELMEAFHLLYGQHFTEARARFSAWESQNPKEPFGEVAVAASYLFEECYRQGGLTSDFFLNEKRFLKGIEGSPAARDSCFGSAEYTVTRNWGWHSLVRRQTAGAIFASSLRSSGR